VHIDWTALLIVAAVSIGSSVVFVALLAAGIRSVVAARAHTAQGGPAGAALPVGYALIGLAGLLVLYGLYLIVPQLH
jgi:hypothetical protein